MFLAACLLLCYRVFLSPACANAKTSVLPETAFVERCSFLRSAFTNFYYSRMCASGGRCKIFGGTLLPLKNMKFPDFFCSQGLLSLATKLRWLGD